MCTFVCLYMKENITVIQKRKKQLYKRYKVHNFLVFLLLFYHTLLYSIPFWVYFQFCYLYHLWPIFMLFICFSSFCYFSFYSCCLYYKSCSFRLVNSMSVRLSFRPSVRRSTWKNYELCNKSFDTFRVQLS